MISSSASPSRSSRAATDWRSPSASTGTAL
jgi:hypothetical protein